MIKVCEHEIRCCPYCKKAKGLTYDEKTKATPSLGNLGLGSSVHAVYCKLCGGLFFVPCED